MTPSVTPAPPDPPAVIADNQDARRVRKGCLLTEGERSVIEPFKERYRAETMRNRRVALVKSEIMVAYFNYLDSRNEAPRSPEELKEKTKV